MAIQITPSGIAQTGMIICAVVGVALVIDSIMFMNDIKTLFSHIGLSIYLDDRVRAVALIVVGGLAFMFGLGIWTVGVGAIAIAVLVYMTYGSVWGSQGWKGTNPSSNTTVQTVQAQAQKTNNGATRWRCPLEKDMKKWCTEDHNNNGILNSVEKDPNQNCKFNSYVSKTKVSNHCKAVQ